MSDDKNYYENYNEAQKLIDDLIGRKSYEHSFLFSLSSGNNNFDDLKKIFHDLGHKNVFKKLFKTGNYRKIRKDCIKTLEGSKKEVSSILKESDESSQKIEKIDLEIGVIADLISKLNAYIKSEGNKNQMRKEWLSKLQEEILEERQKWLSKELSRLRDESARKHAQLMKEIVDYRKSEEALSRDVAELLEDLQEGNETAGTEREFKTLDEQTADLMRKHEELQETAEAQKAEGEKLSEALKLAREAAKKAGIRVKISPEPKAAPKVPESSISRNVARAMDSSTAVVSSNRSDPPASLQEMLQEVIAHKLKRVNKSEIHDASLPNIVEVSKKNNAVNHQKLMEAIRALGALKSNNQSAASASTEDTKAIASVGSSAKVNSSSSKNLARDISEIFTEAFETAVDRLAENDKLKANNKRNMKKGIDRYNAMSQDKKEFFLNQNILSMSNFSILKPKLNNLEGKQGSALKEAFSEVLSVILNSKGALKSRFLGGLEIN